MTLDDSFSSSLHSHRGRCSFHTFLWMRESFELQLASCSARERGEKCTFPSHETLMHFVWRRAWERSQDLTKWERMERKFQIIHNCQSSSDCCFTVQSKNLLRLTMWMAFKAQHSIVWMFLHWKIKIHCLAYDLSLVRPIHLDESSYLSKASKLQSLRFLSFHLYYFPTLQTSKCENNALIQSQNDNWIGWTCTDLRWKCHHVCLIFPASCMHISR